MKLFFIYIKKLSTIIILLLLQKSFFCYSQNTSIDKITCEVSEAVKVARYINQYDIIGTTTEGIVLHKWGLKKHIIEIYNEKNLKLLHSKPLLFKAEKAKVHNIYLYPNNEAIIIYTSTEKKDVLIFAKKINLLNENQMVNNDVLIGKLPKKTKQGTLFIKTEISANKQFIGILCYYMSLQSGHTPNAYYTLLNSNVQTLYPNLQPVQFSPNHQLSSYFISNEGGSLIGSTYFKNDFFSVQKYYGNTTTYLANFEPQPTLDSLTVMLPPNHKASYMQSEIDNNNQQLTSVTILAETQNNSGKLEKIQYSTIHLKNKNIKKNETVFLNYNSANKIDQSAILFFLKKQNLEDLKIHKLILRRDGGIILPLENNYANVQYRNPPSRASMMSMTNNSLTFYYYNDALLLNISPEGSIENSNLLKKIQISEEDNGYFSSFGMLNLKNELYFIFNESIDYNSNLSAYALQANGNYTIKQLFSRNNHTLKFAPQFLKQISDKSVIIPAFDKNNQFIITKFSVQ